MRQFSKILKFELKGYFTNKIFIGVTAFIVAAVTAVMFFPRITEAINSGKTPGDTDIGEGEAPVMLIAGDAASEAMREAFAASFPNYDVQMSESDKDGIINAVSSGEAECAFVMQTMTSYTYYVNNLSMYDINTAVADEVIRSVYSMIAMVGGGLSPETAGEILSVVITHETETLGKDQLKNYIYTYIMIMALYMVILIYGQMVAMNVAAEKSSRAMEVLITSAKPVSMMFGKVIASCLAGLTQIVLLFGSAMLSFAVNKSYWDGNEIVLSIFDMPISLFLYMIVFFLLGFFLFAFLYGAIGSTASKLEDINTSVMPVTLLFVAGFIITTIGMSSGNMDTTLIRVASYVPFTSPMAMFARIAMSSVHFYEIAISVSILILSVLGVGIVAAKIYRIGVLLYGTPPKPAAIIKALRGGSHAGR